MIEKIKNNKLMMQIIKFGIVGGIATIIDFAVFYILHEVLGINTIISNVCSFTISVVYNYIASIKWVFDVDENKNKKTQFVLFIVFSLIGMGINTAIVYICTDLMNLYSMIGKVIATAVVMVFNFITRKKFLE